MKLLLLLATAIPLLPAQDLFESKIRPILAARCYACHSAKLASPMAGLRFDDPVIVQKSAARILPAIKYQTTGMPPTGRLPADEIAAVETWISQGAPVPRTTAITTQATASKPVNHWAWQPLRPTTKSIDELVGPQSPKAPHNTLIRRLSFDLTGLPPVLEDQKLTYAQAVEKYLNSPAFGERWARYWMDVARYADTGFLSRAFLVSFGYRDWLIDAFNRDVPYDRFIALQLAADQMPDISKKDHAALGFLSLGLNPNRDVDLPDVVDDKIDLVTRGLLGLTVSCARCHDHKFDPIPTRDYYGLYGIFANTRYGVEPVATGHLDPWYERRAKERRQNRLDYINERLEVLRAEFREPKEVRRYLDALWEGRNLPPGRLENLAREKNLNSLVLNRWAARTAEDPAFQPADLKWLAVAREPNGPPQVPVEDFPSIMTEGDSNTTRNLQWQYEQILNDAAYRYPGSIVLGAQDRPVIQPANVFVRGNQFDRGDPVDRCFPSILIKQTTCFAHGSGRLELARAITSEQNPVAARVMVNRVWQKFFGEGLVRTPSDFGFRGDPPTHPELLDTLAANFRRDGWSIKRLIRQIVLSEAYQQSSADRPDLRAKDPENKSLWRMPRRRLDFEALRDAMLAVSGRLDPAIGGQPISIVAVPSDPRRTLYGIVERERPLALFKTFDVADPEQHSPQRYQTTVPQQGLFLLNSPFVGEMAQNLAARCQTLESLYRVVLGREPTPAEVQRAQPLWNAPNPPEGEPGEGAWRYGTATFNPQSGEVTGFRPFAYFTGKTWQNASAGVDVKTGVARLSASGGAPGDNLSSTVVRRWVSPIAGPLDIEGKLVLSVGAFELRFRLSNGIRGWLVSSRQGVLGKWQVDLPPPPADGLSYAANPSVTTNLKSVQVAQGEILDFVVDSNGDYEADDFQWAPTLTAAHHTWDARKDFAGPRLRRLTPREQLAQVLLLSNEFAFLD